MYEPYFDLRSILDVVRRRLRLVLAVFIAVLALAVVMVFSLTPKYTASVLVMVDPSRKDLLEPGLTQSASSAGDSARIDSEVEIVKSYETMARVVDEAGLLLDPDFMPNPGPFQTLLASFGLAQAEPAQGDAAMAAAVSRLMSAVSVRRRGLTYLIAISAEATRPATAAAIANGVADAYIESQLQSKVDSVLDSLRVLEPRIADAMGDLAETESAYDRFVDENLQAIVDSTGRSDIVALRDLIDATTEDASALNARLAAASAALAGRDYAAMATGLQSTSLAALVEEHARLEGQLAREAGSEPQSAALRTGIDAMAEELERIAAMEMDDLRRRVSTALEAARALRDDLRRTALAGALPPDFLTRLYQLQQNSSLARTNYERLVERVNDLSSQAAVQVADSRVVAPATPPAAPSSPNVRLALVLAGIVGLGAGIVAAMGSEALVGGFRSPEQLAAVSRREVAATIPAQKPPRRGNGVAANVADTVIASPMSQFSERLRLLRLRVDEALVASGGGRLIVVTSAGPLEGKTTTAIALARTYGAAGQRVLLMDCDLRKPSVGRLLGLQSDQGLLDYVSGRVDIAELHSIMGRDPLSSVSVVVGAGQSAVPTDKMLTGARFSKLLDAARKTFDIVILDTPPVELVVDGIYATQHADAVLFVTKWGQTTQRDVLHALDATDRAKREPVPVVLALNQEPEVAQRVGGRGYFSYARP